MKPIHKSLLIPAYILMITLAACNRNGNGEHQSETDTSAEGLIKMSAKQQKLMDIQLGPVEQREMQNTFSANGKVVVLSQYQASVTPKIGATIEKIHVLEGQKLVKGQLLATLSSNEYIQLQETYLTSRSELEYLKADYERQQKLRTENVISEKDFQLIRSKYEGIRARLFAAEARLRILGINPQQLSSIHPYLEVRSPLNGYLLSLPVNLNMSLDANGEIAHIINLDEMHADIFVYERDIHKVFEGQEVHLQFTNYTLPPCKGRVEFIARGIDPVKRSIIVHTVFDRPNSMILPDMTLKGIFLGAKHKEWTVPLSAIMQEEERSYIYKVSLTGDEVTFEVCPVTIKYTSGEYAAIEACDELNTESRIVVKGANLVEGEAKKGSMDEE